MATAAEIRTKAAKILGVLPVGQTLQAEISSDLDNAYIETYAQLEEEGLAMWAIADEVQDQFVWGVATLTAFARLNEYSVPNDRYTRIVNDVPGAIRSLRRYQAAPRTEDAIIENF